MIPDISHTFLRGAPCKVMFADVEALGSLGINGKPLLCSLMPEDTWAVFFSSCCEMVRERAPEHISSEALATTLFSCWTLLPVLPNGAVLPSQRRPDLPFECFSSSISRFVLIHRDYDDLSSAQKLPLKTHLFWREIAPSVIFSQMALHPLIPMRKDATPPCRIDTLVFEGGGVKGLAFPSALQVLSDANILSGVNQYAGTSAGSIAAVLLAVGFTVKELFQIMAKSDFGKFKDSSTSGSLALFSYYGIYKGDFFLSWIGELIKQKLGAADATFGDLYLRRRVTVVVTGTCLETRTTEYFHWMNFPEMPLRLAVRISMSIPLFFNAVKFKGCHWVDGGVFNNYPISIFDGVLIGDEKSRTSPPKHNVLGLRLLSAQDLITSMFGRQASRHKQQQPIDGLADLTEALIVGMLDEIQTLRSKPEDANRTIPLNVGTIPSTQFQLNASEQLQLIHSGTNAALEYLTCNQIPPGVHTLMTWRLIVIRAQRLFAESPPSVFEKKEHDPKSKAKKKKPKSKIKKIKLSVAFHLGPLHLHSRHERAPEPTWTHELSLTHALLFHSGITFRLMGESASQGAQILGRARLHTGFFSNPDRYSEPQLIELPIQPAFQPTDDSASRMTFGNVASPSTSLLTRLGKSEQNPVLLCSLHCVYPGSISGDIVPRKFLNPSVTRVFVCIESGHDLAVRDKNGLSDPYVVVNFQGQKKKTTTFNQSLDPYWDETLIFDVSFGMSSWTFNFHVFDFDIGSKDDSMGCAEFQLANQANSQPMSFPQTVELPLQIAPNHSSQVSGHIRVTIDLDDNLSVAASRSLKVAITPTPWLSQLVPDWDQTKPTITISIDPQLAVGALITKLNNKIMMRSEPQNHAQIQSKLKKWALSLKQHDGSIKQLNPSEPIHAITDAWTRDFIYSESPSHSQRKKSKKRLHSAKQSKKNV